MRESPPAEAGEPDGGNDLLMVPLAMIIIDTLDDRSRDGPQIP